MKTKKPGVYEVIVNIRLDKIQVLDIHGEVLKAIDLTEVIFSAVERAGFDCNGIGLEYKK